jgi:hypothetical protein
MDNLKENPVDTLLYTGAVALAGLTALAMTRYRVAKAEAIGYERMLQAYNENPELAKFIKGNEAGLWAEQFKQGAEALRGMNPDFHIWQSGDGGGPNGAKNPILSLAEQVMPVLGMVGDKLGMPFPSAPSKTPAAKP